MSYQNRNEFLTIVDSNILTLFQFKLDTGERFHCTNFKTFYKDVRYMCCCARITKYLQAFMSKFVS